MNFDDLLDDEPLHEYNDIQKEIDQLYKQINENDLVSDDDDSHKMTCPICKK